MLMIIDPLKSQIWGVKTRRFAVFFSVYLSSLSYFSLAFSGKHAQCAASVPTVWGTFNQFLEMTK